MHMADALVSTPLAVVTATVSASLIYLASKKVGKIERNDIVPLMGVMGAFIFAAQMINFAIPGTGSSGHIIGGILLSALMGPWAAFLTLSSVLIIQCFIFADGGMMALGCNILNMAAVSTLVAYPLVYAPIAGKSINMGKIFLASITACVVSLEVGAFLVTIETELSGITALPMSKFLLFMLPIHLIIGLCEGIATGLVLYFVASYRPEILYSQQMNINVNSKSSEDFKNGKLLISFVIVALVLAISLTWIASENPDGLEWAIAKIGTIKDLNSNTPSTALFANYDSKLSGIVGGFFVIAIIWAFTKIIFRNKKVSTKISKNE